MPNSAMANERPDPICQWRSSCWAGQANTASSVENLRTFGIGYWSLATGSFANIDDATDQLLHTSIALGGPRTIPAMMAARWDWRLRTRLTACRISGATSLFISRFL